MIAVIIISTLGVLSIFFVIYYLVSMGYSRQQQILVNRIKPRIQSTLKDIRTVSTEESGWKNNFPSPTGLDRCTIFLSEEFALITVRSDFPYLFKSTLQPFFLARNVIEIRNKFGFSRTYRPLRACFRNFNNDYEVTFKVEGALGNIKMHLIFKNLGVNEAKLIGRIEEWC